VPESRFLAACRKQPVDVTPIWMMRQAGRSLPEYRKLRERYRLVDIVASAELCTEVTLQPVRRFGVDAAVMFADIMLPLAGMGVEFELVENVGPVIASPVRSAADVDSLRITPPEESVPQVLAAVRSVVAASPVPVVCFTGAPFTLASYLIEGRPSRDFKHAKSFMYNEPKAFSRLLGKLARVATDYVRAQIACGASAVQVFDSWVGALSVEDYQQHVLLHTKCVLDGVAGLGVPRIHFGVGGTTLLSSIVMTGPDVVSVDWRLPLDAAWNVIGHDRGIQGNLDPAVLLGPPELVRSRARDVLRRAGGRDGHVFNLGHGVLPETPLENLQLLVDVVHEHVHELV
jgi:uroporphyrinogen decarboxylase